MSPADEVEEPGAERPGVEQSGDPAQVTTAGVVAPGYPWSAEATVPAPLRRRLGRRVLASVVAAALALGAGIALGAVTRQDSGASTSRTAATAGGTTSATSVGVLDSNAISAKVNPGIVDINTTLSGNSGEAAGTGMILTASGEVLTNNHVIDGAVTIKVTLVTTGKVYAADVVGYDTTEDVAVLQLRGASDLPTITTGNSSNVAVGDPIVAIGNAGGTGGLPTVTPGVVSAVGQTVTASDNGAKAETLTGMIQVDADIQPGDSGGALVNAKAQVVGMTTAASVSGGRFQQATSTVGFAIPIDNALSIARKIEAGQASSTIHIGAHGLLGVNIRDSANSSSSSGALVVGVQAGSPAAAIGISTGSTIVALNGSTISSASDLTTALAPFHPGDAVSVTWNDAAGQRHTAMATLIAGAPA